MRFICSLIVIQTESKKVYFLERGYNMEIVLYHTQLQAYVKLKTFAQRLKVDMVMKVIEME